MTLPAMSPFKDSHRGGSQRISTENKLPQLTREPRTRRMDWGGTSEDVVMADNDRNYYADNDEVAMGDSNSDGDGEHSEPAAPRNFPPPIMLYDSDEDSLPFTDAVERQESERGGRERVNNQNMRGRRPPYQSSYGNDSEDELKVLTSIESEGDGRDPFSEEIQYEDDEPDGMEMHQLKGYYQGLIAMGLGQVVPLINFPLAFQKAGYGNTQLHGPWEGDLTDIHPVFQLSNWIREPDWDENNVLWQRLQPSLKLATKFITNNHLQGWWIRALLGHQIKDKTTKRWYLSDPGTSGAEEMRRVSSKWAYLVRHVSLSFAEIKDSRMYHQTHGMTTRTMYHLDQASQLPPGGAQRHVGYPEEICIGLHRNFRRFLLSKDYEADGNLCNRMRTNWVLAVTITHELAHAFYVSKAGAGSSFIEPYFDLHDMAAEIGWSWERFMWGPGEFQCFIDLNVGAIGLHWGPWYIADRDPSVQHDSLLKFAVSPHWMHAFFQEATWNMFDMASADQKATFWKPPQCGMAVTQGPPLRNSAIFQHVLLSDEWPDKDRRSINYWWAKSRELLKREFFMAKTRKARKKIARQETTYRGRIHKNFVPPRDAAGYEVALRRNPAWTSRS